MPVLLGIIAGCSGSAPIGGTKSGQFEKATHSLWHDVTFDEGSKKIANRDALALRRFLDDLPPADNTSLLFLSSGEHAQARIASVAQTFRGRGFEVGDYEIDAGPSDAVRIIMHRDVIRPLSCKPTGSTPTGCVNDQVLHQMVENRRDLIEGRDFGPAPAAPAAALAKAAENPPSPPWWWAYDGLDDDTQRLINEVMALTPEPSVPE